MYLYFFLYKIDHIPHEITSHLKIQRMEARTGRRLVFTLPTEGRIDSSFVCFYHGDSIKVGQIKLLFEHTLQNEATNLAKIDVFSGKKDKESNLFEVERLHESSIIIPQNNLIKPIFVAKEEGSLWILNLPLNI